MWAALLIAACAPGSDPIALGPAAAADAPLDAVFRACEDAGEGDFAPEAIAVIPDPYERAALTAVIVAAHEALEGAAVERIRVGVRAADGGEDLIATLVGEAYRAGFDADAFAGVGEVAVPVLGLYADHQNLVGFEIETAAATFAGCAEVETAPLEDWPGAAVTFERLDPALAEPGWTYLDEWVYDDAGRARWIGGQIHQVLGDGALLMGVDQRDWLGGAIVDRALPDHLDFHHDAIALPGGAVAACVDNAESQVIAASGEVVTSQHDYVVELAADGSEIVNAWDLRAFLDVDRDTVTAKPDDWLHMNTLLYDAPADALIISARYQGVISLSRGGQRGPEANRGKALRWILAPHLDWGPAGWDGQSDLHPADYLLTAVDAAGAPYGQAVQENLEAPPASGDPFHWPVGQHGLVITHREGDALRLLVFNNQASVLFDGPGTTNNGVSWEAQGDQSNDRPGGPYSQIAEYEIDESAMTVRLLWEYGAGLAALYGSHEGGVSVGAQTGNRFLITTGYDQHDEVGDPYNPIVLEVTPAGDVVSRLEATDSYHSAYRGGRVDLYGWATTATLR